MEFINDSKARLSTFLNRRKGLEKKSRELSTLCGVQVGLIIFSPGDISSTKINEEPLLYPEDPNEIKNIINSFLTSDPVERKRKNSDLSGFYLDKTKKARDELIKLQKDNTESLFPVCDHTYNALSVDQLHRFANQLETNIQAAKARLDSMKRARSSGLMGCGSDMNLYDGGKLALCENDQLGSLPVLDMWEWNSMQADVIQPQEISHQEGGLFFPPFDDAMTDSPGSMWTMEDASSSSGIMFNMDLETKNSYNSWSGCNALFDMDLHNEIGRHNNNMMAGFMENTDTGILENQHDHYFLFPSSMEMMQWDALP